MPYVLQRPITWLDFQANLGHHAARFNTERPDIIPVYLGDDTPNPYACFFVSIPVLRQLWDNADERLLEFFHQFHTDKPPFASSLYLMERNERIPEGLAASILERRQNMPRDKSSFVLLYDPGQGFAGALAIYGTQEDTSFFWLGQHTVLVLAPENNDWCRQALGGDARTSEEIAQFGSVPDMPF